MNPNELLTDIASRTRRIETKLTRLITGDGDQGVTKLEYDLVRETTGWKITFNSASVTLYSIAKIIDLEGVPAGDFVDCYDNDRYMVTVLNEV